MSRFCLAAATPLAVLPICALSALISDWRLEAVCLLALIWLGRSAELDAITTPPDRAATHVEASVRRLKWRGRCIQTELCRGCGGDGLEPVTPNKCRTGRRPRLP